MSRVFYGTWLRLVQGRVLFMLYRSGLYGEGDCGEALTVRRKGCIVFRVFERSIIRDGDAGTRSKKNIMFVSNGNIFGGEGGCRDVV